MKYRPYFFGGHRMWPGSGFITIINYSSYAQGVEEEGALITESGQNILTEDSKDILV